MDIIHRSIHRSEGGSRNECRFSSLITCPNGQFAHLSDQIHGSHLFAGVQRAQMNGGIRRALRNSNNKVINGQTTSYHSAAAKIVAMEPETQQIATLA
jgi:hypothetical protein